MTQIQIHLNAKEVRELFDPEGQFAERHTRAFNLLNTLREHEFHIFQVKAQESLTTIRLCCGAILTVYEASGKILVQGKFEATYAQESYQMLRRILPAPVVWSIRTPAV